MAKDLWLNLAVLFLVSLGTVILRSIAPALFPVYFIYLGVALVTFWFFSSMGFEVISLFSKQLYIISIGLLILTLIIGRVTHGTIRWIPIGPLTLQPSELVRPFLLVFFADYLVGENLNLKKLVKAVFLLALPVFLIVVQPSLGVSILTVIGFFGVLAAASFNKKNILIGLGVIVLILPILWFFLIPYQKQRILTFINPSLDPLGAGYNSLQSTIAAGAGGIFGRGLGKGVQTQLLFLPEKQTDFIFAAVSEELGLIGAAFMLLATFVILYRLSIYMESSVSPGARAYLSGFFLIYLLQVFIHAGMNMGLLPVTGLPFPLVSAGGSSLLATMIGLGIAVGAYRR